jgi:ParB/RepB/Spo0J family partition protein
MSVVATNSSAPSADDVDTDSRDTDVISISVSDIDIPDGRRGLNVEEVKKLAKSIMKIGLQHPITVRQKEDGRYQLIAGVHRMMAYEELKWDPIPASVVSMTDIEARKWQIAENLHRAELTALEWDEQTAEWIRLTESNAVQVAPHKKKGQQPGGISAAARELGIEETDAKRSVKVDGLSPEAKDEAVECGMDDNRTALLDAANEKEPEAQVKKIREYSERNHAARKPTSSEKIDKQFCELLKVWGRTGPEAQQKFLANVGLTKVGG